jgi:hypothetical protein
MLTGCGNHDRTEELQQQELTLNLARKQNEQLAAVVKSQNEQLAAFQEKERELSRILTEANEKALREVEQRKASDDKIVRQELLIRTMQVQLEELKKKAGPTPTETEQEFEALVRWIEKAGSEWLTAGEYTARLLLPVKVNSQAHTMTFVVEYRYSYQSPPPGSYVPLRIGGNQLPAGSETVRLVLRRDRGKWIPDWDKSILEQSSNLHAGETSSVDGQLKGWFHAILRPYLIDR